MNALARYVWNILIWLDQGLNTLAGGDPDETVSSRCAKRRKHGCRLCHWLCVVLAKLDEGHCRNSLESDEGRDAVGYRSE